MDFGSGENQFTIDFVRISADTNPTEAQTTAGDLHGFGIVQYDYRIGVYEITQDQWTKFVAQTRAPHAQSHPMRCSHRASSPGILIPERSRDDDEKDPSLLRKSTRRSRPARE